MTSPKIAFLNRCYWPDVEATGQLLEQLCGALSSDWDITVVAGQPNKNLTGQEFVRRGQQKRDGVTIYRLPPTTRRKRSKVGRLITLLSFTSQTRRRGRRVLAAQSFDVIVSESDPFFLPIVAAPIARRMGAKHVHFTEYQPIERLTDSLSAADLHVESPDASIHECLAPSKRYGILASGTPVMAITPDMFSIAREIQSHQVGRAVEPGSISQIVEHVCWGIEHPHGLEASGEIARRLVQAKYERRIASQQIADVLNSVCDRDRSDQQPSSTPETYSETQ
ncbi:hypothetical protein [Rosistilla oblonga]|uniref:hypothetical protein n=1 Tax=Rosistilla oblonga TaxID=2527990 RepID=UPI003A96F874